MVRSLTSTGLKMNSSVFDKCVNMYQKIEMIVFKVTNQVCDDERHRIHNLQANFDSASVVHPSND